MRRFAILTVVGLAVTAGVAIHVATSSAGWHILSETAINTKKSEFMEERSRQEDRRWEKEMEMRKLEKRTALVLELVKQGKTPDEVKDYLSLMDNGF